jgi:hypothetical protein
MHIGSIRNVDSDSNCFPMSFANRFGDAIRMVPLNVHDRDVGAFLGEEKAYCLSNA